MEYRNPQRTWLPSVINCEINHPVYGWIPFSCDPTDTGANFDVADLYTRLDTDPSTVSYTPPTQEELNTLTEKKIRNQRDFILATQVDSIVSNPLRWSALTADQQTAWADYRRALLDITQQVGFPNDVVWPTAP